MNLSNSEIGVLKGIANFKTQLVKAGIPAGITKSQLRKRLRNNPRLLGVTFWNSKQIDIKKLLRKNLIRPARENNYMFQLYELTSKGKDILFWEVL